MTKINSVLRMIVIASVSLLAAMAWGHEGHDHSKVTGVVKDRMESMSAMAARMKAIRDRLRAKSGLSSISKDAAAVRDLALAIVPMFPPGSTQPPTEASTAIWQNFADFEGKAKALAQEADRLATITDGDPQRLAAQAAAVNDVCSSCHEKYRIRQ